MGRTKGRLDFGHPVQTMRHSFYLLLGFVIARYVFRRRSVVLDPVTRLRAVGGL